MVSGRLPQLIGDLRTRPSPAVAGIVSAIGQAYPQQTFYAIRNVLSSEIVARIVNAGQCILEQCDESRDL